MGIFLLYFAFPFILYYIDIFFMQGNHNKALIFHIDTLLSFISAATSIYST